MNWELPLSFSSTTRLLRGMAASAVGVALMLSMAPPSGADELDDRRSDLTTQIAEQAEAVDHASGALTDANAALDSARQELGVAEAALAAAEDARRDSEALDELRAEELAAAEHALDQAEADVAAAQAAFDYVEGRTNEEIIVITQQNGPLLNLALLVTDISAAELNQRAQLSTTLFDASAMELDALMEQQFALDAAKAKADEARAAADEARAAAAAQLQESIEKEAVADDERANVEDKVAARDSATEEAENQLDLEQGRQEALEAESVAVDKRIAERVAAQKAAEAAAAKKAAAQKAAEEAAARKAAAAKASADSAKRSSAASKPQAPAARPQAPAAQPQANRAPAASSPTGFTRPVAGRLSSAFGMRLHPVLGIRKLHDGTDFAAGCGTPLRAAAAGRVSERYFNRGYGNRLMIDHGKVNGKYVTTGYNHATRYTVRVGERVAQGEIVGYVGTTGYSTGCHLHLMVWENGSKVNPMAKWFR